MIISKIEISNHKIGYVTYNLEDKVLLRTSSEEEYSGIFMALAVFNNLSLEEPYALLTEYTVVSYHIEISNLFKEKYILRIEKEDIENEKVKEQLFKINDDSVTVLHNKDSDSNITTIPDSFINELTDTNVIAISFTEPIPNINGKIANFIIKLDSVYHASISNMLKKLLISIYPDKYAYSVFIISHIQGEPTLKIRLSNGEDTDVYSLSKEEKVIIYTFMAAIYAHLNEESLICLFTYNDNAEIIDKISSHIKSYTREHNRTLMIV